MSKKDLNTISESTDLILNKTVNNLIIDMPEHKQMLSVIQESLPEIKRGTSLFCKTQSQFMDNMLTVSHPTPLRNARQILAEMNKTTEAIKELHFKTKKQEVELKMKQRELENEPDELKQEMLEIEMFEIMSKIDSASGYLSGAIRKLTNYTEQYNAILKSHGKEKFTEKDFEEEEVEYHIKKAFEQAVNAARARQGIIDEGNLIYFSQIGINGGAAQKDVYDYLNAEQALIRQNITPDIAIFVAFLSAAYKKYAEAVKNHAKRKGMADIIVSQALLLEGKKI